MVGGLSVRQPPSQTRSPDLFEKTESRPRRVSVFGAVSCAGDGKEGCEFFTHSNKGCSSGELIECSTRFSGQRDAAEENVAAMTRSATWL